MRQRHIKFLSSLVFLSTWLPSVSSAETALNATVGTTGLGLEWITPFSDKLRARVLASYIDVSRDLEIEGVDYDSDWKGGNFGALLDWHPFGGLFRFSSGLVATSFGIDLSSTSGQATYSVGGNDYTGNMQLAGSVDYAPVAPYLGIGWASRLDRSGMFFGGELGMMYIGKASVSYAASGTATSPDVNGGQPIDVSRDPSFQSDLEAERQKLEDDLDDYSLYPIVVFSIGYRF